MEGEKEKIQELADILIENKLIEIHYPPVGDPILKHIETFEEKGVKEREKRKKKLLSKHRGSSRKSKVVKVLYGFYIAFLALMVVILYLPELSRDIPLLSYLTSTNLFMVILPVLTPSENTNSSLCSTPAAPLGIFEKSFFPMSFCPQKLNGQ